MVSLIVCGFIGIVAMMTIGSFMLPFPVPFVGTIFFMIILAVGIIKRKKDSQACHIHQTHLYKHQDQMRHSFGFALTVETIHKLKMRGNIVSLAKNIYKVKKIKWGVVVK